MYDTLQWESNSIHGYQLKDMYVMKLIMSNNMACHLKLRFKPKYSFHCFSKIILITYCFLVVSIVLVLYIMFELQHKYRISLKNYNHKLGCKVEFN